MKKILQICFGVICIAVGVLILVQGGQDLFTWMDVAKGLFAILLGVAIILGAAVGGAIRRLF